MNDINTIVQYLEENNYSWFNILNHTSKENPTICIGRFKKKDIKENRVKTHIEIIKEIFMWNKIKCDYIISKGIITKEIIISNVRFEN